MQPKSSGMTRLFGRRRVAPARYTMELPLYSDDGRAFRSVKNRRILIYWPHGLGDFVHLSYVVPLLEPTNEYYLTRFGDDYVHLYDEEGRVRPLLSGVRVPGNGSDQGALPHFGLDLDRPPEGPTPLDVPEPLRSRIEQARIDAMLVCRYPEMTGRTPYPFHTKARYLASRIASPAALAAADFARPLHSALTFRAPSEAAARVEARLREFVEPGERLYVLSAGGHTQVEKIWPETEIVAFAREAKRRDPRARVISVDERSSIAIGRERGLAPTTTDLFADLDLPFAHVLLPLVRAADAYVGVAAGPLHCAIAMGGRPTVGIWLAHWPEYYDEPSPEVVHLVGPAVYRRKLDRRIGARTNWRAGGLSYRIVPFHTTAPAATDVLEALVYV
jgi:hypothetical protein